LFNLFESKNKDNKTESITRGIKKSFDNVKKEFEEHLEAINENTSEIQSNYEFLLRLESKIEKMDSKLSEIDSFIRQFKAQNVYFLDENECDSFVIEPLTDKEKAVFRAIYELETESIEISYSKLADFLQISTALAREYVTTLIEKGVPISKSYLNRQVYINLEPKFREFQTKKNIICL
jgi:methyl-accepting chemotaxis protein